MSTHDNWLIIGGGGFIGANTADFYLEQGKQVTVFDDFSRAGSESNIAWLRRKHGDRLKVVRGDVRHDFPTLSYLMELTDVAIHLAAQVAVTTSVLDPRLDFEINSLGTFNVLEAARLSSRQPAVLFASTNKVYGKMADLAVVDHGDRYGYADCPGGISESRPLDFYSPYGCSKGSGDQYVMDYARSFGLKTVVMRQSCIYGPHQFGIEDQGWVAWFAIRAMQAEPVSIYGDGKQVRDVLFVGDLIQAYDLAIRNLDKTSGQAYNIGGGPRNTLSLLELIALLERRFERPMVRTMEDWRTGDQKVFVSNTDKANADFGWTPRTGVEAGLDKLLSWLTQNRGLFEHVMAA